MKKQGICSIVLVALLILSGTSYASTLNAGLKEFRGHGIFKHSSQEEEFAGTAGGTTKVTYTNNSLSSGIGFGLFLTDMVELMVTGIAEWRVSEVENDVITTKETTKQYGAIGSVILNFPSSGRVIPFVGGGVGMLDRSYEFDNGSTSYQTAAADLKTTYIMPRVEAGFRFLVGQSASVNLAGFYEHRENAMGIEDATTDDMGVSFGISIFLNS